MLAACPAGAVGDDVGYDLVQCDPQAPRHLIRKPFGRAKGVQGAGCLADGRRSHGEMGVMALACADPRLSTHHTLPIDML